MNTNPTPDALAEQSSERSLSIELREAANLLEISGDFDLRDACREAADSLEAFHAKPVVGEDEPESDDFERGKDAGATFVMQSLAELCGVPWTIRDGSETWDGDVWATMYGILEDARVVDPWDNSVVKHAKLHEESDPASLQSPPPVVSGEWKQACRDMTMLAADERDRAILLTGLLERAREYVADDLEAHEHSDGRDLLNEIDAALTPISLQEKTMTDDSAAHLGDPCIYCHTPHDEVAAGPCPGRASIYAPGLLMACGFLGRMRDQFGPHDTIDDRDADRMRLLDGARVELASLAESAQP